MIEGMLGGLALSRSLALNGSPLVLRLAVAIAGEAASSQLLRRLLLRAGQGTSYCAFNLTTPPHLLAVLWHMFARIQGGRGGQLPLPLPGSVTCCASWQSFVSAS